MNKFITFFALLFGLITALPAVCQEHHDNAPEPSNHTKRTGVYEIIVSGINAYGLNSKHNTYGSELHFTYWVDHVWGFGLGYTVKFEDEEPNINELALLGSWNPTTWLTLNAGPSFTLPRDHHDLEVSAYLEAEFNYRLTSYFHFGPVIGTLKGKETELLGGFQLGFEF